MCNSLKGAGPIEEGVTCNGPMSEFVCYAFLYFCAKFGAFITKSLTVNPRIAQIALKCFAFSGTVFITVRAFATKGLSLDLSVDGELIQ